jgi:hypothetical protein
MWKEAAVTYSETLSRHFSGVTEETDEISHSRQSVFGLILEY